MFYEVVDRTGRTLAYCIDLVDADIIMKRHNDVGQGVYVREAPVSLGVITHVNITYSNGTAWQGETRMQDRQFVLPKEME